MKKSIITMAAALALVSCQQDQLMPDNPVVQTKGQVGANVFVPTTSRGAALNEVQDLIDSDNGFDLFAFSFLNNGDQEQFMYGVEFAHKEGAWDYANRGDMKFWKDVDENTESMKFFAISPTADQWVVENESYYGLNSNAQQITYTVPTEVSEQVDLMYAQTDLNNPSEWGSTTDTYLNGVPLNFHHALSQIVFKARIADKDENLVTAYVNSITVQNVHGAGTFYMNNAAAILNQEHIDYDGELEADYSTYNHELWSASDEATNGYIVRDLTIKGEINSIDATDLTDGTVNGEETAMILMPQPITKLDLTTTDGTTLGGSANENQFYSLNDNSGAYFVVNCRVNFEGNAIVGDDVAEGEEGYYKNLYIPINTEAWNPGYKYIYTLVFSADAADPVKADVKTVDVWNTVEEGDDSNVDDNEDNVTEGQLRENLADYFTARQIGEEYYFEINSEVQLKNMRDFINAGDSFYPSELQALATGTSTVSEGEEPVKFLTANYIQTDDIDLSGEADWEPIGTWNNVFSGNFTVAEKSEESGEYYTISNLTITSGYDDDGTTYGALFYNLGWFKKIENVRLINCNISNVDYAAGIVYSAHGQIINCVVGTDSDDSSISAEYDAGGISASPDNISNCKNYANVNGDNAGGISSWGGAITGCENYGNVSGRISGGIMGMSESYETITNSHNYGNVSGSYVSGGIIGWGDGNTLQACHNEGSVTSDEGVKGGLVGHLEYYGSSQTEFSIIGCYNVGGDEGCNLPLIGGVETASHSESAATDATLTLTACYNTATGDYAFVGKEVQSGGSSQTLTVVFKDCFYENSNNHTAQDEMNSNITTVITEKNDSGEDVSTIFSNSDSETEFGWSTNSDLSRFTIYVCAIEKLNERLNGLSFGWNYAENSTDSQTLDSYQPLELTPVN